MAGLEPANEGVKVPCLTAWLHPYWEERAGAKSHPSLFVGWVKGLEPSTPGTTIRCSNQLSYTHHISGITREASPQAALGEMVRQKGFEPPAFWSVGCLKGKSESFRLRFVLFGTVYSADFPLLPSSPACFFRVLGQKWVRY